MAQPNPNDTKFEQQRSDAAEAALEKQTENNNTKNDANDSDKDDNKTK